MLIVFLTIFLVSCFCCKAAGVAAVRVVPPVQCRSLRTQCLCDGVDGLSGLSQDLMNTDDTETRTVIISSQPHIGTGGLVVQ